MALRFLAITHSPTEGPGLFADLCHTADIQLDTVELSRGDRCPDLRPYDALLVMGGAMNVGDEDQHPWLVEEKALIHHAVTELEKPYLGTCLGAQLLAAALGGRVGWMQAPEVGIHPVQLTSAGQQHPLLDGLPRSFGVFQWHGQEVQQLPEGATVLASSDHCPIQAYSVGNRAFGLQFHSEVDHAVLTTWLNVPAYCVELEATVGVGTCDRLKTTVPPHLPDLNQRTQRLFSNFIQLVV